MLRLFFVVGALLFSGCASMAPQTQHLLRHEREIPRKAEVAHVPFIEQSENYCGPASLAMVMSWAQAGSGKSTSAEEVAPSVFTPGAKGTFQTDMTVAARRHGFMAVPIANLPNVLKEVAAGHPVVVFENLGLSWYPRWHYAVVYGYDLEKEEVLMHSGPERAKRWDLVKFERAWKLGDYWALVVLPAGEISAAADELAHSSAASALENLGFKAEAEKSYRAILSKWPESFASKIGLANLAFAKGEMKEAVALLTQATLENPNSAMAWHNLAVAQAADKRNKEASVSAKRAIELAPLSSKAAYEKNLAEYL